MIFEVRGSAGKSQNFRNSPPPSLPLSLREPCGIVFRKLKSVLFPADVVDAAKACLPQGPTVTNPEVLGCIDFSLSPEQMLKLEVPHSMFGSSEICRSVKFHAVFFSSFLSFFQDEKDQKNVKVQKIK
jgi:hypothetical protein